MMVACAFFKFYKPDLNMILNIHLYVGIITTILLMLLIPESPRWLFLKYGPTSKEGIESLNYIAWFNGSNKRIP